MAGGKETPRQKMIGMMYLVLTALLAMNVSKSVLDSFLIINEGLEKANVHFTTTNKQTIGALKKSADDNPGRYGQSYKKAQDIEKAADELYEHIEYLKKNVIGITDKPITDEQLMNKEALDAVEDTLFDLHNVDSKDNYDEPTRVMIGSDAANPLGADVPGSSLELKQKIQEFKDLVRSKFKEGDEFLTILNGMLTFEKVKESDGTEVEWEIGNFYHLPLAAVVTNLTRIQADVRSVEAESVKEIAGEQDKNAFKVDNLAPKVIPNSKLIMLGDSFSAQIFVAASSSALTPELELYMTDEEGNRKEDISAESIVDIGGGIKQYGMKASQQGTFNWGGIVKVQKPDGSIDEYKIPVQEYSVIKAGLTVSPTAMNVFYRGLDNPISVSAPGGFKPSDLQVSCTNGTVKPVNKRAGTYIVRPGKGKDADIIVKAQGKKLGSAPFRVKNVPNPTPYFAGVTGTGNVSSSKLKASLGVIAKMENFQFDIKYTVKSFSMSMMYKGNLVEAKGSGNRLTSQMKTMLQAAKRGTKVYIEDIKADGPGGLKSLGGISIKVL